MANEITLGFTFGIDNGGLSDSVNQNVRVTQTTLGKSEDVTTVAVLSGSQVVQGTVWKPSAKLATIAALPTCTYANGTAGLGATLTGDSFGAAAAVDGVSPSLNDYVLVKNQVAGLQNGLYKLTTVGDGGAAFVYTRVTAMDTTLEFVGAVIYVEAGGTLAATTWNCTNASAPTLGSTSITFGQSSAGTLLDFGSVSSPGYIFMKNLDASNYIQYGPSVNGVMQLGNKLKAGEMAVFRLDTTTTLRAIANTGAVKLWWKLYAD